jgi:hypothetical protein
MPSIRSDCIKALINPIPYKTTLDGTFFPEAFPVMISAAVAIAHRMTVFT